MDPKLKALLSSRKFWAMIVGLLLVIVKAFRPDFPLSEEQVIPIIALLVTYILGTAIDDAGRGIGSAPQTANQPPPDPGSKP
jgi:hypothetical protein